MMMDINKLKEKYKEHKQEISKKLKDFDNLKPEDYLYELIFCILTPQSKAEKCWEAVEELKKCQLKTDIESCLKPRTRFYRNKTRYLKEAMNKFSEIEKQLEKSPREAREYLVKNVKGLGLKEASHFLRNIGKSQNQLAILDRHVLRKLEDLKVIDKIALLNKKNYTEIEKKMKEFSERTSIPLDELDLLFWKIESGRIFK